MELSFLKKVQENQGIWSFYFTRPAALQFEPGDYLDVELSYENAELGGRRWLTISSSPHQKHIRFTSRIFQQPSTFKLALMNLKPGNSVQVSPPIGTFHLPRNPSTPIAWLAAGIGITPFLSQSEWLIKQKQQRNIMCVYLAKDNDYIFENQIESVATLKKTTNREYGLKEFIPDYHQRTIYLSGPEDFCMNLYNRFKAEGMERHQVHLDYFPGYQDI